MTISAARGQGMRLAIDKDFIDKENKNLKILTKTYVMYLKKKAKNM